MIAIVLPPAVASCGVDKREVTPTHDFFLAVTRVTSEQYLSMAQWNDKGRRSAFAPHYPSAIVPQTLDSESG